MMQSMGQLPIHTRPGGTSKLNKPPSVWEVFTQHNKQEGWQFQCSALSPRVLYRRTTFSTTKLKEDDEKVQIVAGQRVHIWPLAFTQEKFRGLQNTSQDHSLGSKLSKHQQKTNPCLTRSSAFGGEGSSDVRTWQKPP